MTKPTVLAVVNQRVHNMSMYNSPIIHLVVLLLLTSMSFAYPALSSTGSVCFNLNASAEALTGSAASSWYDVAIVALPHNGSFSNATLTGYYVPTSASINVFKIGENATHYFMAIPIIESISTSQEKAYCLYETTTGMNDLHTIAPYNLGFDGDETLNTVGGCTAYSSSGIVTMTSIAACGLRPSDTNTYQDGPKIVTKMRANSLTAGSSTYAGAFVASTPAFAMTSGGYGIGTNYSRLIVGFYSDATPGNIMATDSAWHIYKSSKTAGLGPYTGYVYDENYTTVEGSSTTVPTAIFGVNMYYAYPAYVRNANASFDWGFMAQGNLIEPNATAVVYDYEDTNITIVTPSWGLSIPDTSSLNLLTTYATSYDNCSVTVNGVVVATYGATGGSQSSILSMTSYPYGANYINVSCYLSGVESHRYGYFIKTSADVADLFENAFESDLTASCNSSVIAELTKCEEYYHLRDYYNYSAVVCKNLNHSVDYSCLSTCSFNKTQSFPYTTNYTIFYLPCTWSYANVTTGVFVGPHTGAWFYYNSVPIASADRGVSIELLNSTKFIYGPAQRHETDCGIYYGSTSYCGYWGGVVLNNAPVVVSDEDNNWYIAGGNGVYFFDANYSGEVIPVSCLKLIDTSIPASLNNMSITTRAYCQEKNGSLYTSIVNTLPVVYVMSVEGTSSYTVTTTDRNFDLTISLTNVSNVSVTANGQYVCRWGSGGQMFLPFNFTWLGGDGFGNILIYLFTLFVVMASVIVPYALVGVILINDMYHVFNITQVALIVVLCALGSIITNITQFERGVKHMIVLAAVFIAYFTALGPYQTDSGIATDHANTLMGLTTGLTAIFQPSSLGDFLGGVFTFLKSLFEFLLTLPWLIANLIIDLVGNISPILASQLTSFRIILTVGFYAAILLKAYEVIRNTFRNV